MFSRLLVLSHKQNCYWFSAFLKTFSFMHKARSYIYLLLGSMIISVNGNNINFNKTANIFGVSVSWLPRWINGKSGKQIYDDGFYRGVEEKRTLISKKVTTKKKWSGLFVSWDDINITIKISNIHYFIWIFIKPQKNIKKDKRIFKLNDNSNE